VNDRLEELIDFDNINKYILIYEQLNSILFEFIVLKEFENGDLMYYSYFKNQPIS